MDLTYDGTWFELINYGITGINLVIGIINGLLATMGALFGMSIALPTLPIINESTIPTCFTF